MVVKFEDKEQLEFVSYFVNLISGIYDHSAVSTISTLAGRLTGLCAAVKDKPDTKLSIDLVEDTTDNHDHDQLLCLYNIMKTINDTGADEYNACSDLYIKLKKYYTKSDVPRFLEMLRDCHVPAEYCMDLFSAWCSGEGGISPASIAEECIIIQAERNIIMTPVWKWLNNNNPTPGTDYQEELNKYREAIDGCIKN